MVNDEKYVTFLKQIIACISYGDYYSVKELSQLELEKMEKGMNSKKGKGDVVKIPFPFLLIKNNYDMLIKRIIK